MTRLLGCVCLTLALVVVIRSKPAAYGGGGGGYGGGGGGGGHHEDHHEHHEHDEHDEHHGGHGGGGYGGGGGGYLNDKQAGDPLDKADDVELVSKKDANTNGTSTGDKADFTEAEKIARVTPAAATISETHTQESVTQSFTGDLPVVAPAKPTAKGKGKKKKTAQKHASKNKSSSKKSKSKKAARKSMMTDDGNRVDEDEPGGYKQVAQFTAGLHQKLKKQQEEKEKQMTAAAAQALQQQKLKEAAGQAAGKTEKPPAKQTAAQKAMQEAKQVAQNHMALKNAQKDVDTTMKVAEQAKNEADQSRPSNFKNQDGIKTLNPNPGANAPGEGSDMTIERFKSNVIKGTLDKKQKVMSTRHYLEAANAAVNAATEALTDAEKMESVQGRDSIEKKPGMNHLVDARAAVIAAHESLAKAAKDSGLGDLPVANIVPLTNGEASAKTFTHAAGQAVNAAELALDNLASVGYPEIMPSQDSEGASVKHDVPDAPEDSDDDTGSGFDSSKKSLVTTGDTTADRWTSFPGDGISSGSSFHESTAGGEAMEEANNAVDAAHTAIESAESEVQRR